jgi:hypothetical protein
MTQTYPLAPIRITLERITQSLNLISALTQNHPHPSTINKLTHATRNTLTHATPNTLTHAYA